MNYIIDTNILNDEEALSELGRSFVEVYIFAKSYIEKSTEDGAILSSDGRRVDETHEEFDSILAEHKLEILAFNRILEYALKLKSYDAEKRNSNIINKYIKPDLEELKKDLKNRMKFYTQINKSVRALEAEGCNDHQLPVLLKAEKKLLEEITDMIDKL